MLRDLLFALRSLRRSPGFTLVAVLTLALGIGANTAMFSVVNSVLLRPLPGFETDRLVDILDPRGNGHLDPKAFRYIRDHNQSFEQTAGLQFCMSNLTGLAEPEQVRTVAVSDGVFETLDVLPAVGRWLSSPDQVPNGPKRVMLSYGYWQRRFGGDPAVIGRNITIDSQPREIVGVMPNGFQFVNADFDVAAPLAFDRGKLILAGFGFHGIARLKPGATIAQANADLTRMLPIWMDSWSNGPGTNPHIYETWRITPMIRPLKQ